MPETTDRLTPKSAIAFDRNHRSRWSEIRTPLRRFHQSVKHAPNVGWVDTITACPRAVIAPPLLSGSVTPMPDRRPEIPPAAAWHASSKARLAAPTPARFRHRSETARPPPRHRRRTQGPRLPAVAPPPRWPLQGGPARPCRIPGHGLEGAHRPVASHRGARHHHSGTRNTIWPQVHRLGYSEAR